MCTFYSVFFDIIMFDTNCDNVSPFRLILLFFSLQCNLQCLCTLLWYMSKCHSVISRTRSWILNYIIFTCSRWITFPYMSAATRWRTHCLSHFSFMCKQWQPFAFIMNKITEGKGLHGIQRQRQGQRQRQRQRRGQGCTDERLTALASVKTCCLSGRVLQVDN